MSKLLFTACAILCCLNAAAGQDLQGNVAVSGSVSIGTTGHSVTLTWDTSPGATAYNVYRGTLHGGPYTKIAAGLNSQSYIDLDVSGGQSFYYVTTALSGTSESGYSNEVETAVP